MTPSENAVVRDLAARLRLANDEILKLKTERETWKENTRTRLELENRALKARLTKAENTRDKAVAQAKQLHARLLLLQKDVGGQQWGAPAVKQPLERS